MFRVKADRQVPQPALEGLSAPEISQLMDVPVPTTYSRLRQARLDVTAEVRRLQQEEARP